MSVLALRLARFDENRLVRKKPARRQGMIGRKPPGNEGTAARIYIVQYDPKPSDNAAFGQALENPTPAQVETENYDQHHSEVVLHSAIVGVRGGCTDMWRLDERLPQ